MSKIMPQIIVCENLKKTYRGQGIEFEALKGLSFSIPQGELTAITGPSGCGKSTLLNILGLLDNEIEGNYFFNGKSLKDMKDSLRTALRRSMIGFVFQNFNLLNNISILENIKLPLLYNGKTAAEAEKRALELLALVDLSSKKNNTPLQISGGQKQRVCIARALANDPKLIIADEPTGNLDIKSGTEVMEIFKKIHSLGYNIIMVTHDISLAKNAERIITIVDGRITDDKQIADRLENRPK